MAKKNTVIKERVRLIGIAETVAVINPISWDNNNNKYIEDEKNGKYSINLCIDKDSPSARKLEKAFNSVVQKANFNLKIGEESKRFKSLIRDGDDKEQFIEYKPEVYQNCWVVSLKNNYRPTIYDIDGNIFDINDNNLIEEQLYRGVTLTIIADLYTLNKNTNKGIFGSLSGIKVLKLTEPLNADMTVDINEFDLDEEEISYFLDPDF
jgi:hypothetical protein